MKNKKKRILIVVLVMVLILSGGVFFYISDYYHGVSLERYFESSETVTVSEIDAGWFFDGAGTQEAIVFYPGAKVEAAAYAPLLYRLAQEGIDCFLVEMPCNLAIFGVNKADEIIENYEYGQWYMAGHSMGGAMAAAYAQKNAEKLTGLIFLAAYSANELSRTELKILSIYGSNDGVLNMDKVIKGRELMPSTYEEICIEGGNHAQFGSYGEQTGDNAADISGEEQIRITTEYILRFMGSAETP